MASSTQRSLLKEVLKAIPKFLHPATLIEDEKEKFKTAFCAAKNKLFGHEIDEHLDSMVGCLDIPEDISKPTCRFFIVVGVALCADIIAHMKFTNHDLHDFRNYVYSLNWFERFPKLHTCIPETYYRDIFDATLQEFLKKYLITEHPDEVTQTSASAAGGNAHEVAQSSASTAIDSRGGSSITADADLSEKRHRVNSSTASVATVDTSRSLLKKMFFSSEVHDLLSPSKIHVPGKEFIEKKVIELQNAMNDSDRFNQVLEDFCNPFVSVEGTYLSNEGRRSLAMIVCLCIDHDANVAYLGRTLTEYVRKDAMKRRILTMLQLSDNVKPPLEALLLAIVNRLEPDKAARKDV